jgi:hypothetical protein
MNSDPSTPPAPPSAATAWQQLFQAHQASAPTTIDQIFAQKLRDNLPIAPPLTKAKPNDTTRLYFNNPNGLALLSSGGQFDEWMLEMKRIDADLICIAEHNIDTTSPSARRICHESVRRHFRASRLAMASSSIPSTSRTNFKPGGTMLLSQGKITGRIITSGVDPMGRWSFTKYAGTHNKIITVIVAYQVCDKPVIEGRKKKSSTVAAQ